MQTTLPLTTVARVASAEHWNYNCQKVISKIPREGANIWAIDQMRPNCNCTAKMSFKQPAKKTNSKNFAFAQI